MLAEGLGLLQGLQQLQTWQVGKQATGFGSRTAWRIAVPGTSVFIDPSTGFSLANASKNAQLANQLGSSGAPFISLEEALSVLAEPATAAAWATPRNIYLAAGTYTVGAGIIRRSLNFIMDPGAIITDTVMIESSDQFAHSAVGPVAVGFFVPEGLGRRAASLPGGIQVDQDGAATRQVLLTIQGIEGVEINVGAGVDGALTLSNAGAEVHAPVVPFDVVARDSTIEGTTLECESIFSYDSIIEPTTVTCVGTEESRLYSTRFTANGAWTGGTLLIDPATNYDWATAFTWTKANPGGVAPTVMV